MSADRSKLTKERQGNLELLRVVSMLMVLLVHADGASLGLPSVGWGDFLKQSPRDVWRLVIESVAIIGVNCFTLISGYFGIRLRWRTMLRFLLQCIFYSVGIYLCIALIKHGAGKPFFNWKGFAESWLVLSHTDLWYVPAYFGLCLIAPFLNAGCEQMTRRQLTLTAVAFVLFNLWCGWWWGGSFNQNGYTIIQLVMIYLVGRTIARYYPRCNRITKRATWLWGVGYVVAVIMIYISNFGLTTIQSYAYNSPFVMLASIAFFMLFLRIRIQSRAIEWLGAGAFAVYLLHKNPLIWVGYMRPNILRIWRTAAMSELAGQLIFTLQILLIISAIYLACATIDWLRRLLATRLRRLLAT